MVGLKAFWILTFTLLFASCVPMTKQSECGANQAFDPVSRICISSGNISTFGITNHSPSMAITVSQVSSAQIPISIELFNPNNKAYTINWLHSFNGSVPAIIAACNPGQLSCNGLSGISLNSLGGIGQHIVTARVQSAGATVATKDFSLFLIAKPTPFIQTNAIVPSATGFTESFIPGALPVKFGFKITIPAGTTIADWKTNFYLTKENSFGTFVPEDSSTVSFTDLFPGYDFNPALGIGTYKLRGQLKNILTSEVSAEQNWIIHVIHPPHKKVLSRNLHKTIPGAGWNTAVNVYNNESYAINAAGNFVPVGFVNQAEFCVELTQGGGAYGTNEVEVQYYLDGVTHVATAKTNPGTPKVCLTDAPDFVAANIKFQNLSVDDNLTHYIEARLKDLGTNKYYTSDDLTTGAGLGSYPLKWNILVKPTNTPPVLSFYAPTTTELSCLPEIGRSKSCTVTQDTTFRLGVNITDDFPANVLTPTFKLKRGSSAILGSVVNCDTPSPVQGNYLCDVTIPSWDATGPLHPSNLPYTLDIEVSDSGSTLPTSVPRTSLTWTYFFDVKEINANLAATLGFQDSGANTITAATEGDTINFVVDVLDAERDNHKIKVYKCADALCTSKTVLPATLRTVNRSLLPNPLPSQINIQTLISYPIPQDEIDKDALSASVTYRVEVTDLTDTLCAPLEVAPCIGTTVYYDATLTVTNSNPAPVIGTPYQPLTATTLKAFVGYPLTLKTGPITDASVPLDEKNLQYQWSVEVSPLVWNEITGATTAQLVWTPSSKLVNSNVKIRLCVGDGTAINPVNPGVCSDPWNVDVMNNIALLPSNTADKKNLATWTDTSGTALGTTVIYSAYSEDSSIKINKTILKSDGSFLKNGDLTSFETITFPAISGATADVGSIKDLSLVGSTDGKSLYIAYQAADDVSLNPRIRIRRINIDPALGFKTAYAHTTPFGFSYDLVITTDGTNVVIDPIANTITFNGELLTGESIEINGVSITDAHLCPVPSCTAQQFANNLVSYINSSTSAQPLLQGVVGTVAGSVATISGIGDNEYLDLNPVVSNLVPGKLGKILMHSSGTWYLPFIDNGMAQVGRITVLSRAEGTLSGGSVSTNTLTPTGVVSDFRADFNTSGDLVVFATDGNNKGKRYIYDSLSQPAPPTISIFSGRTIELGSLRFSSSTTLNSYDFVAAKVWDAIDLVYEWNISRITGAGASTEKTFTDIADPGLTSLMNSNEIVNLSISTAHKNTEARISVVTKNVSNEHNIYALRFYYDSFEVKEKLTCGVCLSLNTDDYKISGPAGAAQGKIFQDLTLGTPGATVNENKKDVFVMMSVAETPNKELRLSVINSKAESVQSTTTDNTGTLGHRPPFFK